jgi:hypothetical protein
VTTIKEFKDYWHAYYRHIELAVDDATIQEYLEKYSLVKAADLISDLILSQGLGWVEE